MFNIGDFYYPRECVKVFRCVESVNKKMHKITGLTKRKIYY
jgi:hypothetical protein